jgi:pyruvate/2-oxoglutarate dehydrogenase complex dihydrolipoamide dehydrogenase (E3) component
VNRPAVTPGAGPASNLLQSPDAAVPGDNAPADGATKSAPPLCWPAVLPHDEHNQKLLDHVRPATWENPQPSGRYNVVVIGAGAAGLITAAGAAGLGATVALVEKHLLGGDCLNVGCVPSKALIRAARAAAALRDSEEFGLRIPKGTTVDFSAVMERVRRLRASISPNDSASRYQALGVDVYFGQARFTGSDTVEVGDRRLRFRKAVIATGARAAAPPIAGIEEAGYLTNESLFSITELPKRLAVIGAGPIGCELAQAFARLGSRVCLVEALHGVLPNEERDAAEIVRASLERDGVQILCCGKELRLRKSNAGKNLSVESHGQRYDVDVDEILVGVGRAPNTEGLGLEAAGVVYDNAGVKVNDYLQTSNPRIYAAGDICSRYKFTHAADAMARVVIQNALFRSRAKASLLTIPWCTYTEPEIAHVGLYERDAQALGINTQSFEQRFHDVDRAILDGQSEGFVRVLVKKGSDRILGATIVSAHAGELISELTLAMVGGLGLKTIARTIHPYPTQAEAIKKIADAFNRTRLTPRVRRMFETWFRWTR